MDNISRSLIVLVWVLLTLLPAPSAHAARAANVIPSSYCFSSPASTGACYQGEKFGDAKGAASYACQITGPSDINSIAIVNLVSYPVGSAAGLNSYGKFNFSFTCNYKSGGQTYSKGFGQGTVTAEPDCGSPIINYSPASCSDNTSQQPPVACVDTKNAVIPAFHLMPATTTGCYASCTYAALNTSEVTWNGGQWQAGTWAGTGDMCSVVDVQLYGGAPGNAQDIDHGGIGPGDLEGIAREVTLQNVLQAIQAGSTATNANKAILERIATASEAPAAAPTSPDDPDGLEAVYNQAVQNNQVDANGRLPESAFSAETLDVSGTFDNVQGFLGTHSCPVIPAFTVQGKAYQFDIAPICTLAVGLSYLVVALASLLGARIFIGGM